jgi:hypothetical protein
MVDENGMDLWRCSMAGGKFCSRDLPAVYHVVVIVELKGGSLTWLACGGFLDL